MSETVPVGLSRQSFVCRVSPLIRPGRPVEGESPKTMIKKFRLEVTEAELLTKTASMLNISEAEVVRRAIKNFFKQDLD